MSTFQQLTLQLYLLLIWIFTCYAIPGPSNIAFVDDNGTLINLDFSDVEFFPISESLPMYAPTKTGNGSDIDSTIIRTDFDVQESTIVLYLIDTVKFDSVDEDRPRVLSNAKYIGTLRRRYSTSELARYTLSYNRMETSRDRRFNNYSIERINGVKSNSGDDSKRDKTLLASINIQQKAPIGRKIIRLALAQSFNRGNLRTIWLTYDPIWKGLPLKNLGQARTADGWAMMWTDP